MQVVIEGTVGSSYRGDIAIDDINMADGACTAGNTLLWPAADTALHNEHATFSTSGLQCFFFLFGLGAKAMGGIWFSAIGINWANKTMGAFQNLEHPGGIKH